MNELMEQLEDYLKGVWLKRKYIVIVAWLICPIGWLYVASLPDQYRASARIHIDTQSLLKPLLRGLTIESHPQQQIELIIRTLLSRPNMEQVARMADLDLTTHDKEEFDYLIDELIDNIKISGTGQQNLYLLSYDNDNQQVAQRVVQSLLTLLVENTLGETRQNSSSAQRFLEQQIQEYEQRLQADDNKLTEFKRQNAGLLPGTGDGSGYYQRLEQARIQLAAAELELSEARSRRAAAVAQLRGETPNFGILQNDPSLGFTTEYDSRIIQLQQELDRLLVHYTEQHPEVKLTRQRLDELEALRQEEIAQRQQLLGGNSGSFMDQNPVYQELKMAVARADGDVASLQVRVATHRNQVARLEQQVHQIPEVEAELTALTRGYNITKRKYEELLARRETAMLAQAAERSTDEIQFKVIDPPRVEPDPVGPPRAILFSGVTAGGIIAGIGLAFMLSLLNPVVISSKQLSSITGLPVVGYIYDFDNNNTTRNHRIRTLGFIGLLVILVSGYVILVTTQAQLPQLPQLPLLVEQIKGRLFG